LASYFYDYYRYTGDRTFLAERAIPLMKEIALFYEDFLLEQDASGHYIYRPSFSPEVSGLLISDNSTFDIAIAKELLTNLIAACEELQIEQENVRKWRAMLEKMPPYQIGPDGALAEWADGSFRHAYDHRHHSPFYPLFRSFEFSPDATPELWEAAKVAMEKKGTLWLRNPGSDWAGIPFGRAFHAQSAAYLGQGDVVEEVLNGMADRVYPSLHMSLRPDGGIFNFDGNGAFPDIVNRSLAFSLGGTLDLLRSIPPTWLKGSVHGILVRGQIVIEHLQWNQTAGVVNLELTSAVSQEITLRLPGSTRINTAEVVAGDATIRESSQGANARQVSLPAGKTVRLELRFKPYVVKRKVVKRRFIQPNGLPLRLGADSNGQHTFVGDMARVSVFDRVLSEADIASLANSETGSPQSVNGCVASWSFDLTDGSTFRSAGGRKTFVAKPVGAVKTLDTGTKLGKAIHLEAGPYLTVDHDPALDCPDGLTLEAWIRPGQLTGAGVRIIDKSPAGSATAYLLDTFPANSLRLIFFREPHLTYHAKFVADEWVHVAATVDGATGEAALYVGGKRVARQR